MTTRTVAPAPAPGALDRWRRDTPGCRDRIHLNNAGAALMPQPVLETLTRHLEREAAIGAYEAAEEAAGRVGETYELVGRLVGAAARNIALVETATVAFSQALSAFDFRGGDRIVTTRTDYPSNQLMYLSLARRWGVETVRADDLPAGGVDPDSVRRLARHPRTRLVAVSWVPTNSGLVQNARAVGLVCAELGVPYLVDACQSVGQMPVDVAELQCDYLAATGRDRKSTRLNSSHGYISYAVFCLKKKKQSISNRALLLIGSFLLTSQKEKCCEGRYPTSWRRGHISGPEPPSVTDR